MLRSELFPLPIRDWIPDTLKNDPDEMGQALLNKWESNIREYKENIHKLSWSNDPDMCPSDDLPRLAAKYTIDHTQYTNEIELRKDIWKAIPILQNLGLWADHIKIIVDSITGQNSQLYGRRGYPRQDAIVVSYEDTDPGREYYWLIGGPGMVADTIPVPGVLISGTGEEPYLAGNVYINLVSSTLTSDIINRIKNKIQMTKGGFLFYRIFLGYLSGDIFVRYPNGVIP